jgi:lambda repressor-like predicted transcriptional regulator
VKAGLALRGLTLAAWSRERGYPMTTVHQAVHKTRSGKRSQKILKELEAVHA